MTSSSQSQPVVSEDDNRTDAPSAAFAPSPWSKLTPSLNGHTTIRDLSGRAVAAVAYRNELNFAARPGGDRPDPEAEANADLLYAAPELYVALRILVEFADKMTGRVEPEYWQLAMARAALRKAEGAA